MNQTAQLLDPRLLSLDDIDVSYSRLYRQDAWRTYFARLCAEDPVHFRASSARAVLVDYRL
jgi:hypothetical protein